MNDKYNPDIYMVEIAKVLNNALRNGLAIELFDNKLAVCNTVAKTKAFIDLTPWKDDAAFPFEATEHKVV